MPVPVRTTVPAGSAAELQYRAGPSLFGAVANVTRGANGNLLLAAQSTPVSLTDGEIFQGTQKNLAAQLNGLLHRYNANLYTAIADATVGNTNAETTLIGTGIAGQTVTLPANFLVVGKSLAFEMWGIYSTKASAPGTLRTYVTLGGVAIWDTGTLTPTANMSNQLWAVRGIITCRSVGAMGTVMAQAQGFSATAANAQTIRNYMNTAVATVDTTGTLAFNVTATWQTQDVANTITATNFTLDVKA